MKITKLALVLIYFCLTTSLLAKQLPGEVLQQSTLDPHLMRQPWQSVTPLRGGLSSPSVSKVTYGDSAYVIKQVRHSKPTEVQREIYASVTAAEAGYGPTVHAFDIPNGEIMVNFVKQQPQTFGLEQKAKLIAKLLKKIHEGPHFAVPNRSIIQRTIKLAANKISFYPPSLSRQDVDLALSQFKEVAPAKLRPIHGDLNPNNLIFDGVEYKAIDFANAGPGDPFFDLATTIIFNAHVPQFEARLLSYYFGYELCQAERQRLQLNKRFALMHYGLALLRRVPNNIILSCAQVPAYRQALIALGRKQLALDNPKDRCRLAASMIQEGLS